jgi:hypothetical protein
VIDGGGAGGPGPEVISIFAAEVEVGERPGGLVLVIEACGVEQDCFGPGEVTGTLQF